MSLLTLYQNNLTPARSQAGGGGGGYRSFDRQFPRDEKPVKKNNNAIVLETLKLWMTCH